MSDSYQFNIDDMTLQKYLEEQPGRIAFIDESGSFGFDYTKDGTSKYYILCAVVVQNEKIKKLYDDFNEIKRKNGLKDTELKSNSIDDNRRLRIMG
jgi:hypothetical protein